MAAQAQAKAPNVDATIAELKKLFGDRVSTAHAVREQHGKDISFHEAHLPDAVVFAEIGRGSAADRAALRPPQDTDHPLRHRHLAGRPYQRAQRRHLARRQPHEQGAGRERGRPRRGRAARRHPQAAQRIYPRHRPVLPDRSRRRCLDRRHDQHARVRHQRRALRHDARERAVAAGRDGGRPPHAARPPLAQVERRLRSGEAVRRFRGNARRHHRDHPAALRHARVDGRRRPAPSTRWKAPSTPSSRPSSPAFPSPASS